VKPPVTNRDLYEELQAVSKQKHQVKSRFYYLFWGAATLSVFAGQMYVGTGYRRMSQSIEKVLEPPMMHLPEHWHTDQQDGLYHPTNPPQRI
jgi:hypothetical protein